jgi:hypothetical protein
MYQPNTLKTNMAQQEQLTTPEAPGITTYPVGCESFSAITALAGEQKIGNVVVRACPVFSGEKAERKSRIKAELIAAGIDEKDATKQAEGKANKEAQDFCLGACAMRALTVESYRNGEDLECAEKNSVDALERLGLSPEQAIFVAVTGNRVGFSDEFDEYVADGSATINPEGWRQASGFNAFFSDVAEASAIARRLADCGDVNIEFKTKDGKTIIGFMHLTRPGQTFGKDARKFEFEDRKVSYFEHVLREAAAHYDIDWESFSVTLRTAIEAEDFQKHFDSYEAMEGHVPGWLDDGFIKNASNPEWKQGDPVNKEDTFYADFKGIILRDIREAYEHLGLSDEQFDMSNMLDTMHDSKQSSYERAMREKALDTRDLYMTIHRSAVH